MHYISRFAAKGMAPRDFDNFRPRFRRFNPTSGTWQANKFYDDVDDCEKIASSDLSRSNWCPGSDIQPEIIPLNITQGTHTLTIAIPEAQAAKQGEDNYWMVSAYIVYDNE